MLASLLFLTLASQNHATPDQIADRVLARFQQGAKDLDAKLPEQPYIKGRAKGSAFVKANWKPSGEGYLTPAIPAEQLDAMLKAHRPTMILAIATKKQVAGNAAMEQLWNNGLSMSNVSYTLGGGVVKMDLGTYFVNGDIAEQFEPWYLAARLYSLGFVAAKSEKGENWIKDYVKYWDDVLGAYGGKGYSALLKKVGSVPLSAAKALDKSSVGGDFKRVFPYTVMQRSELFQVMKSVEALRASVGK